MLGLGLSAIFSVLTILATTYGVWAFDSGCPEAELDLGTVLSQIFSWNPAFALFLQVPFLTT